MLRRIWHRAAALALPVTLAICLPPLAVIAFNLRAQSTAPTRAVAGAYSAGTKLEKHSGSPDVHPTHGVVPAAQPNQRVSTREYQR